MRRTLTGLALAATALAAADGGKPLWNGPDGSYACALPEGWDFDKQAGPKAIFKEQGRTPPAFINVDAYRASDLPAGATKGLDAFVKDRLASLTVTSRDRKPCKVSGCEAVRASGTFKSGPMELLDLLAFIRGPDRWYAVMLTCLPKDRADYEPVFESFLKDLRITKAKPP